MYEKGVDTFIKAVSVYQENNPKNNTKFVILGSGELKNELHNLAEKLNVEDKIIWEKDIGGFDLINN